MKTAYRVGVIGYPIHHSRSPLIHNYWLSQHHIPGRYDALEISPDQLGNFLSRLPEAGFCGVNLTIPHKETALSFLDHLEDDCHHVRAVNTVVVTRDQSLVGLNTDVFGFTENLRQFVPDCLDFSGKFSSRRALILGAGGVSRACLVALCRAGYEHIMIANRTIERAQSLILEFSNLKSTLSVLEWQHRSEAMQSVDLLVNATSLGMIGSPALDIELDLLPDHAVVYDLVYAPLHTALLKQARRRGLSVVDGLGMLIHQARPAFSRWFGVFPDATEELRSLLVQDLETSTAHLSTSSE